MNVVIGMCSVLDLSLFLCVFIVINQSIFISNCIYYIVT